MASVYRVIIIIDSWEAHVFIPVPDATGKGKYRTCGCRYTRTCFIHVGDGTNSTQEFAVGETENCMPVFCWLIFDGSNLDPVTMNCYLKKQLDAWEYDKPQRRLGSARLALISYGSSNAIEPNRRWQTRPKAF